MPRKVNPLTRRRRKGRPLFTVQKLSDLGARGQTSEFLILVILVLVGLALFADRDFDALCGE